MTNTNYVPVRYEVEGIIRSNDIEAVGAIYDYLYSVKKNRPETTLHLYWYEGIGYAEENGDAEDYPITAGGYAHATEFSGFMTEKDYSGLVYLLKELSNNLGWAMELGGAAGEYSDADSNNQFELKVEDFIEEDEITA